MPPFANWLQKREHQAAKTERISKENIRLGFLPSSIAGLYDLHTQTNIFSVCYSKLTQPTSIHRLSICQFGILFCHCYCCYCCCLFVSFATFLLFSMPVKCGCVRIFQIAMKLAISKMNTDWWCNNSNVETKKRRDIIWSKHTKIKHRHQLFVSLNCFFFSFFVCVWVCFSFVSRSILNSSSR